MNQRFDTGEWPSTEPQDLNEMASSLDIEGTAHFMPVGDYDIAYFNRDWVPGKEE